MVLALPAAVVRGWRRWRRGHQARLSWRWAPVAGARPDGLWVDLDLPLDRELAARRMLTDLVVRVAEHLSRGDEAYHLVYREAASSQPVVLPLGPLVQVLGERFSLALARSALEGRTVLWLVLDRQLPVATVVDPVGYDPEADGEPARLLADPRVRWAVAVTHLRREAAIRYRLALLLPAGPDRFVDALLERLERA